MNKDIRGEIYGYLSLAEKLQIARIGDKILYQDIIDEINETWYYYIYESDRQYKELKYIDHYQVPWLTKKIRGKNKKEILWKLFMQNDLILEEVLMWYGNENIEKLFRLSSGEYDRERYKIKEIRDKILSRNSRKEIISALRREDIYEFIEIWRFV